MSCQCSLCCCNIFLLSLVINSCVNHDAATVDTTERIVLTETYSANRLWAQAFSLISTDFY